jgi:hypothetical protein
MPFPTYVHSAIPSADVAAWPVEGQGVNECGCTVAANALNLLVHERRFRKDDFVREAGIFFQRPLGGSPSPVTTWLVQRHGFGTHFGNLKNTDYEGVLRNLIDRGVPVIIEIGQVTIGSVIVSGQHSILLVGYSDPFTDRSGQRREEYYFVDSQWPALGAFDLQSNDVDVDGDGVVETFPGNRSMARQELAQIYTTRTYFPVFPTQAEHDAWYQQNIRVEERIPLFSSLVGRLITGASDIWVGARLT